MRKIGISVRDAAVAVEADRGPHLDPHRVVERQADALHQLGERVMRADPDAAAGEVLGDALEHHGVPADRAQQVRGEEAAERAADHQRARSHAATFRASAMLHEA